MADSKEHDKSAGSTNSSDDALNWELEDIDSNKEMFAKLVARMDALETENKLADELKGAAASTTAITDNGNVLLAARVAALETENKKLLKKKDQNEMPPSLRVFLFGLLLIGLLILLSGVAIKSAQKCDVAIESNNNNRMELSKLAARMTALEEKVENTLLKEEEKDTAAGILSNRDAKEKLTEKDEAQKEKKERVYNTEEDVVGIYNERIKATVDALTEAVALVERMPMVGRHFNGNVDLRVVVNLQKGHVQGLRQRLYESLDDACSGTAAGEREKLAWVGRARAAMDRFAQVCRAEVVGRIPGPWLKKTGAVGRLVQRLYDGLNI